VSIIRAKRVKWEIAHPAALSPNPAAKQKKKTRTRTSAPAQKTSVRTITFHHTRNNLQQVVREQKGNPVLNLEILHLLKGPWGPFSIRS